MSYSDLERFAADTTRRNTYRPPNLFSGVVINLSDDTGQVQTHQTEGHVGEIRNRVLRLMEHGFSSVPLPGAKGLAFYPSGIRQPGVILATEDTRYRPKGLNPGETHLFMVDGADKQGNNGTLRSLVKGLLGWVTTLFGTTINIGDSSTMTIVVGNNGHTNSVDVYAAAVTIHTGHAVVTNGGTPSPVITEAGPSTVLKADS